MSGPGEREHAHSPQIVAMEGPTEVGSICGCGKLLRGEFLDGRDHVISHLERAGLSKAEPAPKANDSQPVWELVIADMETRDNEGRKKYGVPLQANNGRDQLVDAYQESLDLVVYLRAAIEERDDTRLPHSQLLEARNKQLDEFRAKSYAMEAVIKDLSSTVQRQSAEIYEMRTGKSSFFEVRKGLEAQLSQKEYEISQLRALINNIHKVLEGS